MSTQSRMRAQARDYFTVESGYVPLWVLVGSGLGLFEVSGMSALAEVVWIVLSLAIALMAWWTAAHQVRRGRLADQQTLEIRNTLGKLVSVTEVSPTNIITAAAAKILDLERQLKDLQDNSPRTVSPDQWDVMSSVFHELTPSERSHVVVVFREEYFETANYARQLAALFNHNFIGDGGILTHPNPPLTADVQGLVLQYNKSIAKPRIVNCISRALTLAHIAHREESVSMPSELEDACLLVVGRK